MSLNRQAFSSNRYPRKTTAAMAASKPSMMYGSLGGQKLRERLIATSSRDSLVSCMGASGWRRLWIALLIDSLIQPGRISPLFSTVTASGQSVSPGCTAELKQKAVPSEVHPLQILPPLVAQTPPLREG